MADQWLDVISFRQRGDGKAYAHKIGSAKKGEKGINVYLDSLPLPDKDGRVSLLISARQENSGGRTERRPPPTRPQTPRDDFEDDGVPF